MRASWAIGLVLVVVACANPTSHASPSAFASSSRSASPSAPTPSPAPAPSPSPPALATLDFTCKLPVYGSDLSGFISFPTRALARTSERGLYYDRAVSRWVPVPRQAVSPDGRRYAYTDGWSANPPTAPRLHVVDAATRKELRVVKMPDAQPYQVADFTSTGVFLIPSFEGTGPGVWFFDLARGSLSKVSNGFYPPTGAAWIGVVDPRDPDPQHSAFSGAAVPNRIDRRDESGSRTSWFYRPGNLVMWAAFTGAPALLVITTRQEDPAGSVEYALWLVDRPGHASRLTYSGDPGELISGLASAIADSHGIWIGGENSLFLARRDGAILRAYDHGAYPGNGCF